VKNAKKIVIVGAGAVGVELAAEIVEVYAGKDVTLISSDAKLFQDRPEKLGRVATEWLKSHGVKVSNKHVQLKVMYVSLSHSSLQSY
jgi:NADH dehydrogenase FAD-containing subunit